MRAKWTDLAVEAAGGELREGGLSRTVVKVEDEASARRLGRPMGTYVTLAGQRDIGAHRPAQPPRARLVLHLHDRARQAALAQLAARRLHGQIRPFRPHALASAAVYTSLSAKGVLYTLFPPLSNRQKRPSSSIQTVRESKN